MKKYMLAVLVGMVVNCVAIGAQALTLEWDRNAKPDLKQYQVYMCKVKNCTVTNAGALWVATIPQPAVGTKPTFLLPVNTIGAVGVTAEDTAGNSSGLSVPLPFSTDLAPGAPVNLLLR